MVLSRAAHLSIALFFVCLIPKGLEARQPQQRLPAGYTIEDHGEWRWGAPSQSAQPSARLKEFINSSFVRIRADLGLEEPYKTLFVHAESRREFDRVVQSFGARTPAPFALAVAFPSRSVIVLDGVALRFQPLESYGETIAHEIVHVVVGGAGQMIPRWYHEGIAQLLSGARLSREELNVLALLSKEEGLVPFSEMLGFPRQHKMNTVYYRQSLSFCRYLSDRYGRDFHARLVARCSETRDFDRAFHDTAGSSLEEVEQAWFLDVQRYFSWAQVLWQSLGLFHLLGVILIVGFFMERARRRRRLEQMAIEEAQQDAIAAGWVLEGSDPVSGFGPDRDSHSNFDDSDPGPTGNTPRS